MAHPRKRRRRPSLRFMRHDAPGTPPGTITADPAAPHPEIHIVDFGPSGIHENAGAHPSQIAQPHGGESRWLNLDGLGNADALRSIGARYGLHPLALEDVTNLHHRAKIDDYGDHLFIILPMPCEMPGNGDNGAPGTGRIATEQVSLFLGRDFVITVQERPGDVFDPVRRRMRNSASQMRQQGAGYLAYALIDVTIDSYFPLLETCGERLEELEETVIAQPAFDHIQQIHNFKHDLLALRRSIWPMRDMLAALLRDDSALFDARSRLYLRDCHDHAMQLLDMVETYREIASGLVEIHLSSISNRMNEVMKVLTIIATIFIPLTFVAGVYGMNFDPEASPWNMPELDWRYGYPVTMIGMLLIALALIMWFRRKGWIGRSRG